MNNELQDRLRIFMEKEQMDQKEMAQLLKKPQSTISRYVGGQLKIPTSVLKELHIKKKLNFNWFYMGTGSMKVREHEKPTITTDLKEVKVTLAAYDARMNRMQTIIDQLVRDLYDSEGKRDTSGTHSSTQS